jgi:hypothetical protein
MDDLNYTFGMDLGDLHDAEERERCEKDAALDAIRSLILKHGIDINEIASAIAGE